MARSLEEQETIYRWDAADRVVWGWTAHSTEARRWRALGYPITEEPGGWRTRFPVEALALLPLKAGAVQRSRYLDPPVVLEAPSVRGAGTIGRIPEQNRPTLARAPQTPSPEGSCLNRLI